MDKKIAKTWKEFRGGNDQVHSAATTIPILARECPDTLILTYSTVADDQAMFLANIY